MINRLKGILTAPKQEWTVIEGENTPHVKLFMGYVLPLSFIPAIAAFIGWGLIGVSFFGYRFASIEWGVRQAIVQWVAIVVGVYLTAFIINLLSEQFGAKKDLDKAFSLVAHSYTPMFLGGIFYIYPSLSWLAMIMGIYGLYILYIGLQPMMKVPAEKNASYFVVSLICMVAISLLLGFALSRILIGSFGGLGGALGGFSF